MAGLVYLFNRHNVESHAQHCIAAPLQAVMLNTHILALCCATVCCAVRRYIMARRWMRNEPEVDVESIVGAVSTPDMHSY